jgi:hypothetical protein
MPKIQTQNIGNLPNLQSFALKPKTINCLRVLGTNTLKQFIVVRLLKNCSRSKSIVSSDLTGIVNPLQILNTIRSKTAALPRQQRKDGRRQSLIFTLYKMAIDLE